MFIEYLILLIKEPRGFLREDPLRKVPEHRCFQKVGKSLKNDEVILVASPGMILCKKSVILLELYNCSISSSRGFGIEVAFFT